MRPLPRPHPTPRRALSCTLGAIALCAATAAPMTGSSRPPAESAATAAIYAGALRTALSRAQSDLESGMDLWEDHSTWDDPWRVVTGHYVVQTTRSRYLAVDVGRGLETMFGHFQDLLGTTYAPPTPFEVHVHPTIESYNQFGDTHGEHHSSIHGSFFARGHESRAVVTVYTENPTLLRMQITHSACVQFVESAFGRQPPTWVHMGLAGYFEHYYWAWNWTVDQLDAAKDRDALIPLRRLLPATIDQYGVEAQARFQQLGMLFAYLLHFRPDTRDTIADDGSVVRGPFTAYLRAVVRGQDTSGNAFDELLTTRAAELEADFWTFSFQ